MVTGRRLLLADDSATIRKVVELTFSDEGVEVVTVSDGRQALEMLDEVAPDVVLADVFMPEVNGYQVCEYIKRTERFRHIPVMLLVGSFEPFDEAEARRVGADDYLTKPFQSIRTLIGKVSNLLSGGGATEDATTRKLTPPPEAEKENRPETDFLERSTADTAPLPQHEREERERAASSRDVSLNDLSMDDELIETMPGYDYKRSGDHVGTEEQPQPRATAQYSAADFAEAGIISDTEQTGARERPETVGAYAQAQTSEPAPAAAAGRAYHQQSASADDALLDLGDIEPPQAMMEADDFILDLRDETPAQPPANAPSFAQSSAPSSAHSEPSSAQAPAPSFAPEESSPAVGWDAAARTDYETQTAQTKPLAQDYVEAPVAGDEQTAEASAPAAAGEWQATEDQPAPQEAAATDEAATPGAHQEFAVDAQTAPTERLPDNFQFQTAPADTTGPASGAETSAPAAPSAAGQITLEQLSPEVIDAIARRAVELLSERVVEQIAWEVVPELAELLIRRRLEKQ